MCIDPKVSAVASSTPNIAIRIYFSFVTLVHYNHNKRLFLGKNVVCCGRTSDHSVTHQSGSRERRQIPDRANVSRQAGTMPMRNPAE